MKGYTKLHAKIVMSSIWRAPDHVRLLWITMLALADEDGVVQASVGGLADMARLTVEQTKDGLLVLMSPDEDSSDDTTGERIAPVPGGWLVLNHANYRDKQTRQQALTAERVRRHRERRRQESGGKSVTSNECNAVKRRSASASAFASSEGGAGGKTKTATRPDDVPEETWDDWVNHRRKKRATISPTVLKGLRKQGKAAGLTLAEVMEAQVMNGWQGFNAEWVQSDASKKANAGKSHAPQQTRHNSDLDIGDPACECMSCRAFRRDQGRQTV